MCVLRSRYNLKRRVASLPPLSADVFAEKVLANQTEAAATAAKANFEKTCQTCMKTYASDNAYQNHLSSQRHKQNVAKAGQADSSSTEPRQSAKPTGPVNPHTTCLFCNIPSDDLDQNIVHMKVVHGMYIPERKYLVDLPGLIEYLHAKIQEGNECLFCGVQKRTGEACQSHMVARGHCMIAYTTEEDQLEIGDYYDFRSTYSDVETDDEEEGAKDNDDVRSNASWETTSDCSARSEDIGPLYEDADHTHLALSHHHNHNDPRPHKTPEGFRSHAHAPGRAVYYDDVEMHLPSGIALGHRKYRHIWRQRLVRKPEPAAEEDDNQYTDTDDDEEGDANEDGTRGSNRAETTTQLTRRERRDELFNRGANTAEATKQLISRNDNMGLQGLNAQDRKALTENIKRNQRTGQMVQNHAKAAYEKRGNSQKHHRVSLCLDDRSAISSCLLTQLFVFF